MSSDPQSARLPSSPRKAGTFRGERPQWRRRDWIACYRSVSDPEALAAYAKLAGPAIAAAGGRFLARGNAAKAYEAGLTERVVVIEFDSVERAVAAHDSEGYQAALKVFNKAADRDLQIVEGWRSAQAAALR